MKKIFVKGVNWIGDSVMVTPALRALRRSFPEANITLLARPVVAPVFEANPDIDRLWIADERPWKRFLGITARMRSEKFDLGITQPNAFRPALLLKLGGARQRLGYARDGRSFLLTDRAEATPEILGKHDVEYHLNLVGKVCDISAASRDLVLEPAPGTPEAALRVLDQHGLSKDQREGAPIVAICPGAAAGTAKRWFPDRFAAVADHVVEKWGARVVIVGAPGDREPASIIAENARHPVTILCGEFPLRVAIALLDHFALYVTNDCGGMHMAAGRGVPIVAVFGPMKPWNTGPHHPDAIVVRDENPCEDNPCGRPECPREHACMKNVTVEKVVEAVDRQMEKRNARAS